MIFIGKLKEYLLLQKNFLKPELKDKSTYSYTYGKLQMIDEILEWIEELPTEVNIDTVIDKIKGTEYEKDYIYYDYNYEQLIKLSKVFKAIKEIYNQEKE